MAEFMSTQKVVVSLQMALPLAEQFWNWNGWQPALVHSVASAIHLLAYHRQLTTSDNFVAPSG